MRVLRQVVGIAVYVLLLLVADSLFFAGVGGLLEGSVVGGLVCFALGGLLAALTVVMLLRRSRARTVGEGESVGRVEVSSLLAASGDSESITPAGEASPVEEGEDFSRGAFVRRFAFSLVGLLVITAGAFAAGDHGQGWLEGLLGIPAAGAGVAVLFALAGVVAPRAGRWLDKQQER